MKRISIIGLCLMAVMTVSAVSATSSSATLPEFNSTAAKVAFTSTSLLPLEPTVFSSILETKMNCKMSSASGEIESTTTVGKIKVTFTGCKEGTSSNECTTSGQAKGVVTTSEIRGRIGYVGGRLTQKTVGMELEPTTGTVFAAFTCGGAAGNVTVEGCTIGEAKTNNVAANTGTLLFWENAGLNGQLYTLIDERTEKTRHPCELTVTASVLKLKGKGWIMNDGLETFAGGEIVELKA